MLLKVYFNKLACFCLTNISICFSWQLPNQGKHLVFIQCYSRLLSLSALVIQVWDVGGGKSTYPLPTNANVLSATSRFSANPFPLYYDVSMLTAGGERKVTGRALAFAGSGYINLPTPWESM